MTLSPAIARLIEALAEQDAEAYLREIAEDSSPGADPRTNPVLPVTDQAA